MITERVVSDVTTQKMFHLREDTHLIFRKVLRMLEKMSHEDKVVWFIETVMYGMLMMVCVYLLSGWFYYGSSLGPMR